MSNLVPMSPYRGEAPEVFGVRVEVANCNWCCWRAPVDDFINQTTGAQPGAPGWCTHPEQFHGSRFTNVTMTGTCEDWNRGGDCTRYQPTLGTRLLQRIGLRPRVWRSAPPPSGDHER
jgi:hypothetical protein